MKITIDSVAMNSWARFAGASALVLTSACSSGTPAGDDPTGGSSEALASSFPELQDAAGWSTCSTSGTNCGGAGGVGTPVQSTFKVGTYGGRASAAQLWVGGNVSYGTAYWFNKSMKAPAYQAATVDYYTDFYIPSGSAFQAIEWDTQQVHDHVIFNFAWQANPTIGQWRIFNYAAGAWENSGIPYHALEQGVWHSFHAHYRTSGNTVYADGFVLDGVSYATTSNLEHAGVYRASYSDSVSVGLQLDQNKAGAAYSVYYDQVSLDFSDGSSGGGGGGGSSCSAPSILEPTPGQAVGPAIQLRTSAPACITATKCYLDSNPTPVASAAAGGITQWVSVSMGAHSLQCNGWTSAGDPYPSPAVSFTRTY